MTGKKTDYVNENIENTRQKRTAAPYKKVVSNKNSTISKSIARTE